MTGERRAGSGGEQHKPPPARTRTRIRARTLFDPVADFYDRGRPSYPDALYGALEELAGTSLADAVVLDVGAGTGISARGMMARGARVVALDHSTDMLARLRSRTPRMPVLLGDGHALPLRDGAADLVTYAQTWHWMDAEQAVPEAARVLRTGGALAAWWNLQRTEVAPWLAAHKRRVEEVCPDRHARGRDADPATFRAHGLDVRRADLDWSRTVTVSDFLDALRSRSYVVAAGNGADAVVDRERRILCELFPDGAVEEPLRVHLVVGRKGR